jgi:hypothetical protein
VRYLFPILYFLVGIAFGVAGNQYFSVKSTESSEQIIAKTNVAEKSSSAESPQTAPPLTTPITEPSPAPEIVDTITSARVEATKECPACPCLFSDEILPPPNLDPSMKDIIETNHEGETYLKWSAVQGAKKYAIHVERENGTLVKLYKASRTVIFLKDIPLAEGVREATYFIRLGTINGKDLEGSLGPKHQMHVNPQSAIMAPSIQEIKVED